MSCYLTVCQTQQSAQHIPNLSSLLPVILPSAWRDEFQLFLQINPPDFLDNETGREGRLFNMGAKLRMGVWKGVRWRLLTLCLCWWHISLSLQHVLKTEVCRYRVYLRAVIFKQTCRWRTQQQRKHHRPVPMSTHSSDDKREVSDYQPTTHLHASKINRQLEQALPLAHQATGS